MKLNRLEKAFLRISIGLALLLVLVVFTACNKMPLVTLHQLDTKHGVANPFRITKYNEQTCKLEVVEEESFQIMSEKLHGGFCVTAEDAAKIKAKAQADCENKKQNLTKDY